MSLWKEIKKKLKAVPLPAQYSLSISIFFLLAIAGSLLNESIGYQAVGLIMLLMMSILALIFDILPVLLAAILTALTWNYFFIPPIYEFNFENTEDFFLFVMYFFIAIVNAALSFKAKEKNKELKQKEEREKEIALQNTILNSLSHELRTPISTIIGSVDALNEKNVQLSEAHRKELMEVVSKAALRLNQQVENLLGVSRLESGLVKMHLDWTDINELVHRILQKRSQTPNTRSVNFLPGESLPLFKLDAILIEQVLVNLLQNTTKHTPDGSTITITTGYQNNNCIINFKDNGPGFPEESIPSAFDKFNRMGQSHSRGTGLGLSIVKGFIEAHNGTVRLTNNKDGGACFEIKIPAETLFPQNFRHD